MGHRGPWSLLFPELSDQETRLAFRSSYANVHAADRTRARGVPNRDESLEVSWLLGAQFHIAVVTAPSGIVEVTAGRESTVCEQGLAVLDRHWQFRAPARADLVVVGIGQAGSPATLEDLAAGLETATRLVRHGGKIVVLSKASGTLGPALLAQSGLDDAKMLKARLRGHESAVDYPIARQLAESLEWADVFLLSSLPQHVVEDLFLVALETPKQALRLVAQSRSCAFVSHADLTCVVVPGEDDA
jgi:hypothetical protein